MNSRWDNEPKGGFTLIEVLIAMFILGCISLGIYNAMTGTFKLRDSLTVQGDFYNNVRMAMSVLNRDIEMMYSPTIMIPAPSPSATPNPQGQPIAQAPRSGATAFDESGLNAATAADLNLTGVFWGPALDKSGMRPMRFNGKPDSVSFVTLSHLRVYKDAAESDMAAVTYGLTNDEHPIEGVSIEGTKIFTRTEGIDVFDVDEPRAKGFTRNYPILPGVTKLAFKYCKKDTPTTFDCKNTWDSTQVDPVNTYPDLIKLQLEVKGQQKMFFEGTYWFRPEVPLHGLNPST